MSTICHQSMRSLAFLQAHWILMLTDCTSVSIALSHLGGMWASTRSSPMTGRLERCPKVHISKELKLSLLTREETEKQLTVALVACFVCVLACRINCD